LHVKDFIQVVFVVLRGDCFRTLATYIHRVGDYHFLELLILLENEVFLMKILQVCPRYYPYFGGVEEHVRNISQRLAEKHEVTVATMDPSVKLPKEEVIDGVKIKRFREMYYFSKDLRNYLIKNSDSFDVVHAHSYHAFPVLYAAQAKGRNKLVFTPHYHGVGHTFFMNLLHIPYELLGRRIFEKADKIICVSNYERSLVMKRFKVDEKKVVVIPNGINLEEFKCLKKRSKGCKVILYVGRLEKYKRVNYLIKALSKLDDDIYLEIVGKGLYKKKLVKLINKLGVRSRIKFYQDLPRKDLLQKYADADLVVSLSKFEAYSLTIAEALTAGTPCIVADTSALTEWVDNDNCFGISYPINVDELSKLVNHVIRSNNRGYLRKPTREKIQDWNEVVERLETIYNFG